MFSETFSRLAMFSETLSWLAMFSENLSWLALQKANSLTIQELSWFWTAKWCLLWGGWGWRDILTALPCGNFITTATTIIELGAAFWNHGYSHTFTCRPHGKCNNQVAHINSGSSPLEVSMLFFAGVYDSWWWRQSLLPAVVGQTGSETNSTAWCDWNGPHITDGTWLAR
jgi:hypothetical protein